MRRVDMHHGRVGPAGRAFRGNGRGDRLLLALQEVDLVGPGARGDDALVLEVVGLHGGVVPVALDQRVLLAQEVERRLVLVLVQLVGVLDAELGLLGHQIERGVGDVDGAVIGLDAALVGLAVGQRLLLEDDVPALRRAP